MLLTFKDIKGILGKDCHWLNLLYFCLAEGKITVLPPSGYFLCQKKKLDFYTGNFIYYKNIIKISEFTPHHCPKTACLTASAYLGLLHSQPEIWGCRNEHDFFFFFLFLYLPGTEIFSCLGQQSSPFLLPLSRLSRVFCQLLPWGLSADKELVASSRPNWLRPAYYLWILIY